MLDLAVAQRCSHVAYLMGLVAESAPSVYARAKPGDTNVDIREFYRWLSVASDAVRAVVGDAWFIARAVEAP